MKIHDDDARDIPAVDMAIMIELGWVHQWPFELHRRLGREYGSARSYELRLRARMTIVQLQIGEFTTTESAAPA